MRIHNLYADESGESHFRDIEVEWVGEVPGGRFSVMHEAAGIFFSESSGSLDMDWHPAPRRQYIVNLDAGMEVTASDGEVRVIGTGDVILVEDTTGKGHLTKAVSNMARRTVYIPIE